MNVTQIEEDEDKSVLRILDDVIGGWPVARGYSWVERDFSWTKATVQARKLGVYHHFFLNVETSSRDDYGEYYLWVCQMCIY